MKRFKHMLSVMLVAVLFFSSFPSSEAASKAPLGSATVQVDKSPIFKTKSTKARKVLVLKKGTTVSLINEASGWIYVQQGRTKGYMQSKAFLPNQNKFVTKISSPVYVSASTKTKRVTTLRANTAVTVSKVFNSWVFVTSGKTSGWTAKINLVVKTEKPVLLNPIFSATIQMENSPIFASESFESRRVASLKSGTTVSVISETSAWVYVQYGALKGYMDVNAFVPDEFSLVTRKESLVYSSPSTKAKQVATLQTNADVMVLKVYRSWAYVSSGKVSGWTAKSNLSVEEVQIPTPPVVDPDPEVGTPVDPIIPDPTVGDPAFMALVEESYLRASSSNDWQENSQILLAEINKYRAENGLYPLREDNDFTKFAAFRWDDLVTNNYFAHDSPIYGSFNNMLRMAGLERPEDYSASGARENLAFNYSTPQAVVQGWSLSPRHNEALLDDRLYEAGVFYKDMTAVLVIN